MKPISAKSQPFQIVTLGFVSLYLKELEPAITFYSQVLGAPDSVDEQAQIYGWRMGATWLTLLPSRASTSPESNPRNSEFAIQVTAVEEVDALYQALIAAGAKECMTPTDTRMYEPMRFACVSHFFPDPQRSDHARVSSQPGSPGAPDGGIFGSSPKRNTFLK